VLVAHFPEGRCWHSEWVIHPHAYEGLEFHEETDETIGKLTFSTAVDTIVIAEEENEFHDKF